MNIKIHFQLFEIRILIHVKVVVHRLHLQPFLDDFLDNVDYLDLIRNYQNLKDFHYHFHFLLHFHFLFHLLQYLRYPFHFHPRHLIPSSLHVLLLLDEVDFGCLREENSLRHCHLEYRLDLVHPFCLNFYFILLSYINIFYYLFYS